MIAGVTAWAVTANDDGTPSRSTAPLPASQVPRAGMPAPDFELRTLRGDQLSLASLRGRPVIVNFWETYCHPCREEFPLLRSILAEHQDDDLAIVGVDSRDIRSDARAFVKEQRATWPMPFDEDGAVARAYGVRAFPQTFFIDRDGKIRVRVFGQLSERELRRDVRTITPPT